MASYELRLHWLLRSLTKDRLTLEERSAVYVAACHSTSLGWLVSFTDSAWTDYHPHEGKEPKLGEECLTTVTDAQTLRDMLRDRITDAARSGVLLENRDLAYLLYCRRDLPTAMGLRCKSGWHFSWRPMKGSRSLQLHSLAMAESRVSAPSRGLAILWRSRQLEPK